jgi:predicted CoA-binding protein
MTNKLSVDNFISQKTIALAGASRTGKKMGNSILKELTNKGYKVYPVHPEAEKIDGVKCYPDLKSFPEKVSGLITVVNPEQTAKLVNEAAAAGIKNIWMQQGSQSNEAVEFCEKNKMNYVSNECILMFAEPVKSIHKFHRGIWKIFGKLPK